MNFQPKYYKYILSFLIGIGFLGYQYHSNRLWETSPNVPMPMKLLMPPVETIIPAEIDEQFTTWYLGQTAVDLPDAYQYYFDYNIRLYPKGWSHDSRCLILVESDFSQATENVHHLKDRLRRQIPYVWRDGRYSLSNTDEEAPVREDISEELSRDARLQVYCGHIDSKIFNQKFNYILAIDITVKEGDGFLNFLYTELFTDQNSSEQIDAHLKLRKDEIISTVQDFLPAYNRTGVNQLPGADKLTGRYGLMNATLVLNQADVEFSIHMLSVETANKLHADLTFNLAALYSNSLFDSFALSDFTPSEYNIYSSIHTSKMHDIVSLNRTWHLEGYTKDYPSVPIKFSLLAVTTKNQNTVRSYIIGICQAILGSITSKAHINNKQLQERRH